MRAMGVGLRLTVTHRERSNDILCISGTQEIGLCTNNAAIRRVSFILTATLLEYIRRSVCCKLQPAG